MKRIYLFILLLSVTVTTQAQTFQLLQDKNTDKYGFVNSRGDWIIQPLFDDYYAVNTINTNGFATVKQKNGWGCIDKKGEFIVKPVFSEVTNAYNAGKEWSSDTPLGKTLYLLADKESNKYGFVNYLGNWVILPQFDDFYAANSINTKGFATMLYKKNWGCINKKGEFVINPVFSEVTAAYGAGNEWSEEAPLGKNLYLVLDKESNKYGFVNYLGNWAIPPQFNDFYAVNTINNKGYATLKYKNAWGCINKKGEFVVKPVFSDVTGAYRAGGEWADSDDYVMILPAQVANHASSKPQLAQQPSNTQSVQQPVQQTPVQTQSPTVANVVPPTLKILTPENGTGYTTTEVTIKYQAKTFDNKPADISVYINGLPYDMNTKGVKRAANEITLVLPAREGTNNIQLIAKDTKGNSSEPESITLKYTGEKMKPVLHLLAIGVSKYNDPNINNLNHAAKDAADIANLIKSMPLDNYSRIETPVLITDTEATATNIKTAIRNLTRKVNQDDVVFIYFSGHGEQEDNDTYFLSTDAVADNLYSTAVNFEEIKKGWNLLADKHCKVISFIDACHAGAMYNTKSVSKTLQFATPGVISFYSSTKQQKSLEQNQLQNGVFTKALLDGLKGKAKDKNGKITTLELHNYITKTVSEATNGAQMPVVENQIGEFILF